VSSSHDASQPSNGRWRSDAILGSGTKEAVHTNEPAIRRAVEADAPALLQLSLDAIHVTAAGHYSTQQLAAWAALRSEGGHLQMIRSTLVLVAHLREVLAGFASLDVARAEVDQLFVAPASGGHGVATALLKEIESSAIQAGLTVITAHASRRAVGVFEKCGYHRIRTERVALGDQVLERYAVRRSLPWR
jgi:putative acetyltransferase